MCIFRNQPPSVPTIAESLIMKASSVLYLLCFALLAACMSPVKLVSSEQYTPLDTGKLKTFGFGELTKRVKVNRAEGEKFTAYVQHLVVQKMEAAGFQYTAEKPDLWLDLRLILVQRDEEQRNRYDNGTGFYGRRYSYSYGRPWRNEDLTVSSSMQAIINLTTAEAQTRKTTWKGKATANLSRKTTTLRLTEAVDLIMDNFLGNE